jgi:hypothetical protein
MTSMLLPLIVVALAASGVTELEHDRVGLSRGIPARSEI